MTAHVVRLPHPDRHEPTIGSCACGWWHAYGWGEHGAAEAAAMDHVEQETASESVVTANMAGDRTVMPGVSL